MRLVEGSLCWSATDLTRAAACEYAFLHRADQLLRRIPVAGRPRDPLEVRLRELGRQHEADVLEELRQAGADVVTLPGPAGSDAGDLEAMHDATLGALERRSGVLVQAGFFDGEFQGFADLLEWTEAGWSVADAKLARLARPAALLQVAAYADQVSRAGEPLAPRVTLLLGDGRREEFPIADIHPVFLDRRARLRQLLEDHVRRPGPAAFAAPDVVSCGRCDDCAAAVAATEDVLLVAGVRASQRKLLEAAGVHGIRGLATASSPPDGIAPATFVRLRAQARLQVRQLDAEQHHSRDGRDSRDGRPPVVSFEVVDEGRALAQLPEPSPGDVFFDFEGDPLHRDGTGWGLEYLWGVLESPDGSTDRRPTYRTWWAHDRAQEREALTGFLDHLARRRRTHPDLHVYHYAPYETSALKRLAARYATHERELDELLRQGVFVDLYAVVRASVRVSQPSYSIKKLEPLYMGSEQRTDMAVASGDVSVAEYHEYRLLRARGRRAAAEDKLTALADYNRYDCLSTLRLRDWLLGLARDRGITSRIALRTPDQQGTEPEEADPVFQALHRLAGPVDRAARTPDQQAYALLAAAMGYFRREDLPFWWEHFDRMGAPSTDQWTRLREVFLVASAEVEQDWHVPEGARSQRRRLRLTGTWGPGSAPGHKAMPVYAVPLPAGAKASQDSVFGWGN